MSESMHGVFIGGGMPGGSFTISTTSGSVSVQANGFTASGGRVRIFYPGDDFQGSWLDPVTRDDPRWAWDWDDLEDAAAWYQSGKDRPKDWVL